MKKIMFVFAFVFLIGIVSATIESLPAQKQWDEVNLIQSCANSTYANITKVLYPNSTFALRGEYEMTALGDDYNYSFTDTGVLGTYLVYGHCDEDGTDTYWAYDFEVTTSGIANTLWLYIIIFVFGTGLIVFGFNIQDNWIIVLGGFIIILLGLYTLFYGIVGLKDTVYSWAIGIIVLMVGGYFSIRGAMESLND